MPERTILSASIVATLMLLPLPAAAMHATELDKVIVSTHEEKPLPDTGGQLGADAIDARQTRSSDTARLLLDIPGVSLYGAGGLSSLPAIRGLADDRLRIKVDGMDLISACGNHMNPPLSYISPDNVSKVAVFAGISPVSLGGDSIGGTITVDSSEPEFARPGEDVLTKGEIGSFYRSNGDARGLNLNATIANEHLSINYSGSTTEANNYDAGGNFKPSGPAAAGRGWLDGDEVGSTAYRATNHALGIALHHEHHLLELKLAYQDMPYQGFPNQRMDLTDNKSEQINARYLGTFDWGTLEARAYNEQTRHKMQFGDDKLFWYGPGMDGAQDGIPGEIAGGMMGRAAGMPMETEGDNTGLVVKTDIALSARDILRLGGEIQQYDLDDWWAPSGKMMYPDTFWNIRNGERDRYAAFAEWEAAWNTRWLTQIGIRHETVKMDAGTVQAYNPMFSPADADAFNNADRARTDHNLDLTLLTRFTPSQTQTYEFGYARKTRSPNLYERYSWSTHGMAMRMVNMAGDGNGYVGNVELEPEVAHTLSATLDWHDAEQSRWQIKLSPFLTYVDDYIDASRCSQTPVYGGACTADNLAIEDGFVYLRFDNQSARLYGADLSAYLELAQTQAYGSFTGRGKLSYVRGKNRDNGDNLYNIMPLNALFAVDHKLGGWSNSVEWELVAAKTKTNAERNEVETSGYGLLHLRTSYAWKQARFELGVENVFDRFYAHPLSGAYLGQGKTMSATDVPWGVSVPGMGRSVYAGVSYSF